MRYKLLFIILISLSSCKKTIQEKIENQQGKDSISENLFATNDTSSEQKITDCDKFREIRFPSDSIIQTYIHKILSDQNLTENNQIFLNSLKEINQEEFAFRKAIAPIYRLSEYEIGIFSFPKYEHINNRLISISKEKELIDRFDSIEGNTMEHFGKLIFYPKLLNSISQTEPRTELYFYTTSKVDSTQIKELGIYVDECLEYYEYSIDTNNISLNDNLLFSSHMKIDLVYEPYPKIDSVIKSQNNPECNDCPNSLDSLKTFAKIKGADNLYFAYADTFPINDKLDTPSRALIYINEKSEIIYLWYEEIDLFGCSCL